MSTGVKLATDGWKVFVFMGFYPAETTTHYEQRPAEVKRWLKESYQIKAQAKRENAEIYWGDETGLRNDCHHERGLPRRARHR